MIIKGHPCSFGAYNSVRTEQPYRIMGFDLGSSVNSMADWVCNASVVRGIVSNPVFTALLITALIVIVLMGLYRYPIKRSGTKRAVRALIYIFLLCTAVMFVHHCAVMNYAQDFASQKGVREVFSSIQNSQESGMAGDVPVIPMGYERFTAATGGADCGCSQPDQSQQPARSPARSDNVMSGELVIDDVVLPVTTSPFGRAAKTVETE